MPYIFLRDSEKKFVINLVNEAVAISDYDWSIYPGAWSFSQNSLIISGFNGVNKISESWDKFDVESQEITYRLKEIEEELDDFWTYEKLGFEKKQAPVVA